MTAAGAVAAAEKESAMIIEEEIGKAAGAIWQSLAGNGACSLAKLRKSTECQTPVFDWAIGWLARENKIVITREKKSFLIHLKEL
jgi:Winged helix-turn-helix domain (DUF2582)